MRTIKQSMLLLLMLSMASVVWAQQLNTPVTVGSKVMSAMAQTDNEYHQVYLLLEDRVDAMAMDAELTRRKATLDQRSYEVVTALKQKAQETQPAFLSYLKTLDGIKPGSIKAYWITNMVFVEANEEVIANELMWNAAIDVIDFQPTAVLEKFEEVCREDGIEQTASVDGIEPGLEAINAPAMWALGYTGYNRVGMSQDTGVDPDHPALKDNWRGLYAPADISWYESNSGGTTPFDSDDHGTHTVGTMLGLDPANNDTIGVAFNALWMGSPTLSGASSNMDAFQWALDPDGDPSTSYDIPDVINNSWYDPSASNECTGAYVSVFDALEAVGVAVVFSAGNSGPDVSSITAPKNINTNLVNVFCVANVNGNVATTPVNTSSSRGPSTCGGTGSLLIKPEVSAPGTQVRSSVTGGSYANFTGTSMAAPHVSGAVLLLKEAFPALTGKQILEALYFSARDLGAAGEDNDFGMGIIDVYEAYIYLINQGNVPTTIPQENAIAADIVNVPAQQCDNTIQPYFILENGGDTPLTSAEITYSYSNGGGGLINWTGNLPPYAVEPVFLPAASFNGGTYSLRIEVKNPNGTPDYFFLDDAQEIEFTIVENLPPAVASVSQSVCDGGSAYLNATPASSTLPGEVQWYTDPTGGSAVATGANFLTPALSASTTYYADFIATGNTGRVSNGGGGGGSFANTNRWLVFDADMECTLKSVLVYPYDPGTRTIEMRNSNGTVIQSKTVNLVTTGPQRVELDFDVPVGTDMQLAVTGMADMFRNNSGVNYPYELEGVISVTRSNSSQPFDYYYFFYDWEIEYGSPCGRTEVTVDVNGSGVSAAFSPSTNILDLNTSGVVDFMDNTTGATTWEWDFGDGNTSTMQNPSHSYTTAGTYIVTLTASNASGCIDVAVDTIEASGITSIEDLASLGSVELYPNPNDGQFTLSLEFHESQNVAIEIVDLMGRSVKSLGINRYRQAEVGVDMHEVEAGIYYVRIEIDGKTIAKKVVKQ